MYTLHSSTGIPSILFLMKAWTDEVFSTEKGKRKWFARIAHEVNNTTAGIITLATVEQALSESRKGWKISVRWCVYVLSNCCFSMSRLSPFCRCGKIPWTFTCLGLISSMILYSLVNVYGRYVKYDHNITTHMTGCIDEELWEGNLMLGLFEQVLWIS